MSLAQTQFASGFSSALSIVESAHSHPSYISASSKVAIIFPTYFLLRKYNNYNSELEHFLTILSG